jgi:hypothetical protein
MEYVNVTNTACAELTYAIKQLLSILGIIAGLLGVLVCGGAFERHKNHQVEQEKVGLHRENNHLKSQESQWRMSSSGGSEPGASPSAKEKRKVATD